MNAIELQGVSKRYRRGSTDVTAGGATSSVVGRRTAHWAVRDVSVSVERGAAVALVGSNGSGKSTLLRIVGGVTAPTNGTVRIDGDVNAMLTLGDGFHPLLTGRENALTGAMMSGLSRSEAEAALPAIADFADLEHAMELPVRTYSDGMRLRLAFATSMAVEPQVLLIDEVLAVGDLRFRERCLDRLEELRAAGVTMMFVSHDLEQVKRLCDRAVWLGHGQVLETGPVADVVESYEAAMFAAMAKGTSVETGDAGQVRSGTHEIEIIDARLQVPGLESTTHLPIGGPVDVILRYHAHARIVGAVFAVSVHAEDGELCFDVSTQSDRVTLPPLEGSGSVRLRIDRLDLAAGRYQLDVGVYNADWSQAYDYWWRRVPFEVHGRWSRGVLAPPRRWLWNDAD